ncbi:MAG TPA: ABC transporter ATP-binding protein [Puia sp.]|nr:ABC transporter ATP-binding protein [Puia sp.]
MDLLIVANILKQERQQEILQGVSFTQRKFQKIAVAGESGAGKSSLLKIIAGLVQPDGGEVLFEGERVRGPFERLLPGQPGVAYLSQHFELHNNYRMEELLSYKNRLSDAEADELYDLCRIGHLLQRKNDQVSGGERQRIALAKLLTARPRLLLLDEPYSNLDLAHTNTLKSVIRDLGERWGITCLLVSHDPPDILSWADEILIMKDGSIVQHGAPEQIYRQPVSEYAAGLFGKYNLLSLAGAKAFAELGDGDPVPDGKRMLVRPESFKIAAPEDGRALAGTVGRLGYFGSYSEMEVLLPYDRIVVRVPAGDVTTARRLAPGEKVNILLDPGAAWHV